MKINEVGKKLSAAENKFLIGSFTKNASEQLKVYLPGKIVFKNFWLDLSVKQKIILA